MSAIYRAARLNAARVAAQAGTEASASELGSTNEAGDRVRATAVGTIGAVDRLERAPVGRASSPAIHRVQDAPPFSEQRRAFIRFGPQFERAVDDATATFVKPGNAIEPLFDGVSSFAARKKLIENAKHSIHLQTFIFNDDQTGRETVKLLCAAAQRGVKVRVIYDALGSNRADRAIFDTLRAAGVDVRAYGNPWTAPWTLNSRWHEKLLIVDSQLAVTGGMNIADEYAFGGSRRLVRSRSDHAELPWRDVDVLVSGPLLRDFELDFTTNWSKLGPSVLESEMDALLARVPAPLVDGSDVRFVTNNPSLPDQNCVEDLLWYAITSAQDQITIETAYFAPTPAIREALLDAKARGVRIRILTNSPQSNDLAVTQDVARYRYRELLRAGVEINEIHGGTLHAKTYTFDGIYSIIGSANLNHRSTKRDTESVACMRNAAMAQLLEARFTHGLRSSEVMSEALLDEQPWHARAKQWLAATVLGTFC